MTNCRIVFQVQSWEREFTRLSYPETTNVGFTVLFHQNR